MNPLIIALDIETTEQAFELIERIGPSAEFYKVGMEMYAVGGMEFVRHVAAQGKKVFLDLKLYDIGETVKRATRQICASNAVTFLTVHGSQTVMEAAVEGKGQALTKLLAVTVLTSFDESDLSDLGYPVPASTLVDLRVKKAVASGIDGIVCSALDVTRARTIGGQDLLLVTPGVRSSTADKGDQKRVATPREAIDDGANYLVIGRQITRARDPRVECEKILQEIQSATTS